MTRTAGTTTMPTHVGVVMDGNRRWARRAGLANASDGHRRGADHVEDLLGWCEARGIEHLTVYVLSADNIRKRSGTEVGFLFELVREVLPAIVERTEHWALHVSGDTSLLPDAVASALRRAERSTAGRDAHVTLAIGYDGRGDIVAGIRAAVLAGATTTGELDPDVITDHLAGGPVKEIDLVIRTSGEQRLSGFFPWQTAHAEIHVSPKLWPDFDAADLDLALAQYAAAHPPAGGAA
ncbi:short-chain Z-isoprenyl diphosphate synthase [Nocardioides exalbidus]|uniref:Isoprenyl transferase n=1 Tax=Nocardioides exalbidus TaxID=402596 RepID=A0A1H4UAQ1_9ACTN|nr:polyprenyl diphosphate synthase [Nocardioides exalbidus]SEC65902.1 short-chain Z-isoprenyl diphosphate synthase [Nocardioides exalbidus]